MSTQTDGLDISKLSPDQLAQLQKQLKEKGKKFRESKDERFKIIDSMLQEKDAEGAFVNTTGDIADKLISEGLVDTDLLDHRKNEIKKIQARKQFLEKRTDEKGQLVSPAGTFGYKPSEGSVAFGAPMEERVTSWLSVEANVNKLTEEQVETLKECLGAWTGEQPEAKPAPAAKTTAKPVAAATSKSSSSKSTKK